jgi:hypothetical protein
MVDGILSTLQAKFDDMPMRTTRYGAFSSELSPTLSVNVCNSSSNEISTGHPCCKRRFSTLRWFASSANVTSIGLPRR